MHVVLSLGQKPDSSRPWERPPELLSDDWRNPVSVNRLRVSAAL